MAESYIDPPATEREILAARALASKMRGSDVWDQLDTIVRQRYLEFIPVAPNLAEDALDLACQNRDIRP